MLVIILRKSNLHRIETSDEKDQRIANLEAEVALLRQKLDALARRLYGKSSEQLDPNQLQLLLQGLEEPKKTQASSEEMSEPEEADDVKRKKTKAKNNSRIKGLDTLETEEQTHFPVEYEANPEAYEIIGQEVTELLDYVPARCVRQVIKRVKVRLKGNRNQPPILAPAPTAPLVGGLPSFNLVTDLIIGKYADHLPLYRQQGILQRCGVHIPRDSLNNWTLQSLQILEPLAAAIHQETLNADYLQGDETPLRLLQPGTGKCATSYFWVFNDPTGSLSYHWSNSRAASNLTDILGASFQGLLQCDGYSAYTSYQKKSNQTQLGSCMAHIRRKFNQALEAKERNAALIMKLIGQLYQLEEQLRKQRAGPSLREATRRNQARPLLNRLHKIITTIKPRHLPKSHMGQAINYALGQWSGLDAYLLDGRVELDNNLIENAIRPTKLGQKNWLFLGSERGGELAAIAFTIIENCKRYNLDLREYLSNTMKTLVEEGPACAPYLTPKVIATHPTERENKTAA